ncbi:MAG: hydrogenase expression/formation protein HypE [Planctomycetaceae bacterium]
MTVPAWQLNCPAAIDGNSDRITLAHGEGARLTRRLIDRHIRRRFRNDSLDCLPDAAHVTSPSGRIAVTTDSFVVSPLFFPGGDIGSLAVHGTVNDLAVSGALPKWITLSMILEEGLPMAVLERILDSVAAAAGECRVDVVAGDTKVVPRGAADGIFLTTTGIGELIDPVPIGPSSIQEGDVVLVSGPIGRHGVSVLCAREELSFSPPPESDSAPLTDAVERLRTSAGSGVRTIRDATRGGVSAVLHEWSAACGLTFRLNEAQIPVTSDVRAVCELLGLDPLHIACEGTLVAAVAPEAATAAVESLRTLSVSKEAAVVGTVGPKSICPVTIQRSLGREQPVDEPSGSPLPRIC